MTDLLAHISADPQGSNPQPPVPVVVGDIVTPILRDALEAAQAMKAGAGHGDFGRTCAILVTELEKVLAYAQVKGL